MQTYNELLSEFHQGEESILEEDCHSRYIQLLNQLKMNRQKKLESRKKFKYESSRLKSLNSESPKNSIFQKSHHFSRFIETNDANNQKRSLIQLEGESLLKEIANITIGFQKIKTEKQLIEQEIHLIDKKEIEISVAFCESQNNLQELRALIKEQKQINSNDFHAYDKKISELTEKLRNINQENLLNAKYYEHLSTVKAETKNKSILGTILMWQNEESKVKKLPKKIYTKSQIESMLRALFLIKKFSELNYGNIIEHLIKISEPKSSKNVQINSQNKIFLNDAGEEISVSELITRLEAQLLTPDQCKFLSKTKIFQFYAKKGIVIESDWDPSNLMKETTQLIKKVVAHFQNLTSWFSRIQKRNLQLSQNFRSLLKIEEQLENQIKSIENSAAEKSIGYLQSREQEIQNMHQKLNSSCRVIFLFNINMHDLIRRFQNINKFFDKIVKSTNRQTLKKTFVQDSEDTDFLKKINKSLFKSPQCIILDWNNVIKRARTETSFMASVEMLEKLPQNDMYFETIMGNDLLRIYAEPSMFERNKSYIENLKKTFDYVLNEESEIISKLCSILEDLLMFSKKGIEEYKGYLIQKKEEKQRASVRQEKQASQKINPLLKLLQQSNVRLDKFFNKDEIKEDEDKPPEGQAFCVQSNEFYRRDNFKLIQKLQKLELKRKGLLPTVPFAVNTSLELEPFSRTIDDINFTQDSSRFGSTRNSSYRKRQPRLSHQLFSSRHNMISERREIESSRKKDLKNLLSNISNIASGTLFDKVENHKYRIRKKLHCQDEILNMSTSRISINRMPIEGLTKREKNK